MVNRTQTDLASPLFEYCTSRRALRRAWEQVRPRVLASRNSKTRRAAVEFQAASDSNIFRLQRALRSGKFVFEPQQAVPMRSRNKPGQAPKEPRPLVIAPVLSRIVQRAILDCLQSSTKMQKYIGEIPAVLATPTSVGGLPGKGVPQAIAIIRDSIDAGATWFVRSDLKKFFQNIDKPTIHKFMHSNIRDIAFLDLFARALKTELANEDEVRELLHLFPLEETGVPQGSALSAFCANVILREFDEEMNRREMCCVRYLDDFVILGRSKRAVDRTWQRAKSMLADLGLECHDPESRSGKASMGEVRNGFEFLSFSIKGGSVVPSKKAQLELLGDLRNTIQTAKSNIASIIGTTRRAEPAFVHSMVLLDRKIRGWGDAFSASTDSLVFSQLDNRIGQLLDTYRYWFTRQIGRWDERDRRRGYGISLLVDRRQPSEKTGISPQVA